MLIIQIFFIYIKITYTPYLFRLLILLYINYTEISSIL